MFKAARIVLIIVASFNFQLFAQAPVCSGNYFYQSGNSNCIWYHPAENPNTSLGGYFILPTNASGLAIGPNFSMSGPNPTYWTTVYGNYYYYNGSTFVNTGHNTGGTGFINPGAGANYIFNINSSGQVSKYNGTGNATIIATYTDCAGGNAVEDVVADINDNYYILKTASPQSLNVYNANGGLICAYSMTNCSSGFGLAINRGIVSVLLSNNNALQGSVVGNSVVFAGTYTLPCGMQNDLASCANDVILTPSLRAEPDNLLPCLGGTRVLTSDDATATNSYTWSGPGIVGSTFTQSITVNLPGVYSRTNITCANLMDVKTFTVVQIAQAPLTAYQSALVKCDNSAPVTLSVSGLSNYTWSPSVSLSAANGSLVLASPNVPTTYTITAQLNGCTGTTTVTLGVFVMPNLNPTSASSAVCIGNSVQLSTQVNNVNLAWFPGNITGQSIIVSPTSNTNYTLVASASYGCTKSETISVSVHPLPQVGLSTSEEEICAGQTVTLTASGADSYSWTNAQNSSQVILTPANTTTYQVTGYSLFGCAGTASIVQKVNICTGNLDHQEEPGISVFPNPGSGTLFLNKGNLPETVKVVLKNHLGQIVLTSLYAESKGEIKVGDLPAGIYFVALELDGNQVFHGKYLIR